MQFGSFRVGQQGAHAIEAFYLDRDERPESDSETNITGINYEWSPESPDMTLGLSYMTLDANELAPDRDGADVLNLRIYTRPFGVPLDIDAEWVDQDNGQALDATAWYFQPYWSWENAALMVSTRKRRSRRTGSWTSRLWNLERRGSVMHDTSAGDPGLKTCAATNG